MRTKHWLPLLSGLVVSSLVVACSSDTTTPVATGGSGGHAGTAGHGGASGGSGGKGGSGGSSAGSTNGGTGGAAGGATGGSENGGDAGASQGGSGGATGGSGGAAAGTGGATGGSGGKGGTGGASGGTGGASGGTGGASGGTGGASGGTGGASGGTGGASGGTGGASGGSGGDSGGTGGASGGTGGGSSINLCDQAVWRSSFEFCGNSGYPFSAQPQFAVDGDTGTYATTSSAQNGTYFARVDLHGSATVSSVTLDYGDGGHAGDKAGSLKLQGSDDGTTWTDIVATIAGDLDASNKLVIPVPTTSTHRYLKVIELSSSGSWWALPELTVACTGNGTPATATADAGTASNRAQWKLLTPNIDCAAGDGLAAMIDADGGTKWQSGNDPGTGYWIHVDMGTTATLKGVHLTAPAASTDFPPGLKVQVSTDDLTWTDAITGVTGAVDVDMVFPTPQTARYFRVVSTAGTGGSWWSVANLDADF